MPPVISPSNCLKYFFAFLFFSLGIIRPRLQALGMANGRVRNNAVRASSIWDRYHAAWRARLNVKRQAGYKYHSYFVLKSPTQVLALPFIHTLDDTYSRTLTL